jgi:pimeloyl-ACP methyl ester carboxylesterase
MNTTNSEEQEEQLKDIQQTAYFYDRIPDGNNNNNTTDPSESDNSSNSNSKGPASALKVVIGTFQNRRAIIAICVVGSVLALAGLVTSMVWFFQRKLIYFPSKQLSFSPSDFQIYNYEDLTLTTRDGVKIHCWLIKSKRNSKHVPTIVHFHGNAGNISHRLELVITLQELDCNIMLVSYRGYGKSSGSPSEKGLCLDAQAAIDFLQTREDLDLNNIFIMGSSIGGAVAIDVTSKNQDKVRGLILENTFTNMSDMVNLVFPYPMISKVASLLLLDKWESRTRIATIDRVPILFLSGASDSLIPPHQMDSLWSAADRSPKRRIVKIANGDHNDTYRQKDYMQHIVGFIRETSGEEAE